MKPRSCLQLQSHGRFERRLQNLYAKSMRITCSHDRYWKCMEIPTWRVWQITHSLQPNSTQVGFLILATLLLFGGGLAPPLPKRSHVVVCALPRWTCCEASVATIAAIAQCSCWCKVCNSPRMGPGRWWWKSFFLIQVWHKKKCICPPPKKKTNIAPQKWGAEDDLFFFEMVPF